MMSTAITTTSADPPVATLALVAGIALADAVRRVAPDTPVLLKWPNDLLLGHRKCGGILLEGAQGRVVAGFGLNVATVPEVVDRPVSKLGDGVDVDRLAEALVDSFADAVSLWRGTPLAATIDRWKRRAHPVGARLGCHDEAGHRVEGAFAGLDATGAARIRCDDGREVTLHVGDVDLLDQAEANRAARD